MTTYKPFDVVEVPFPFVDSPNSKIRKALVISHESFNKENGATILAMITSATHSEWKNDVSVNDLQAAGLKKACVVRFKLFTIQNDLIKGKVGALATVDSKAVKDQFKESIAL